MLNKYKTVKYETKNDLKYILLFYFNIPKTETEIEILKTIFSQSILISIICSSDLVHRT